MIGREPSANVNLVLKVPTVSSTHAMIDFVDGEYFLTDLSSTNGTFLNGARNSRVRGGRTGGFCHCWSCVCWSAISRGGGGGCSLSCCVTNAGEELPAGKPIKLTAGAEVIFGALLDGSRHSSLQSNPQRYLYSTLRGPIALILSVRPCPP